MCAQRMAKQEKESEFHKEDDNWAKSCQKDGSFLGEHEWKGHIAVEELDVG